MFLSAAMIRLPVVEKRPSCRLDQLSNDIALPGEEDSPVTLGSMDRSWTPHAVSAETLRSAFYEFESCHAAITNPVVSHVLAIPTTTICRKIKIRPF